VRVGQALVPKEPRNLRLTLVASAGFVVLFLAGKWLAPWSPKRGFGLVFGIFAALAFVFEMVYPSRRPKAWPLGTARRWIQAHVYVGVLAMLAVVVHTGFTLPRGAMGWWLLLLSLWVTLTGLLGVWLQKWIPAALAEGLRVEALYERIPALVERLLEEADALMADAGDVLERFYQKEVRVPLSRLAPSWAFVLDVRGGQERALEPFRRMSGFVDAAEKGKVDDLMSLYSEKMELDAQYSLQGILRGWLWLHVPAAGLLMGLLVIHIFTWIRY
jgi:hypothetical protein